jgi:hypothetical protein
MVKTIIYIIHLGLVKSARNSTLDTIQCLHTIHSPNRETPTPNAIAETASTEHLGSIRPISKVTCHQPLTPRLSLLRLSSNIPSLSPPPSPSSSSTSSSSSASGTLTHSFGTTQGSRTPTPAALFSQPGALLPVNSKQSSLVKWLQFLLSKSYSRPMNFAAVFFTISSISAGDRNEMPCSMLQRKDAPGGVASGGVW